MIRPLLRFSILCLCLVGLAVGGVATGPALALTNEQNLVAEVWRIVNRAYVDDTFNHQNWWFTRQRALERSLASRADTYQAILSRRG